MVVAKSKMKTAKKMVAPDGGWGWMIVIGAGLINFSTRAIEPSFGLLFGDTLEELGVGTTGASVIMSLLDAMINFSGLFVGPLIKSFSYRKVSVLGAFLCVVGLAATAPAASMPHILSTYSVIGGIGVGLAQTSGLVALNNYFLKYRGQAIGLSMAATAVGFMLMPQAVQLLLREYSFKGCVLILGAAALHSVVGSLLLHPVKWHMKPAKDNEENDKEKKKKIKAEKKIIKKENGSFIVGDDPETKVPLITQPKIEITAVAEDIEAQKIPPSIVVKRSQMPKISSTSSMSSTRKRKESIISEMSSMDFTGSSFHIHTPVHSDDEEDDNKNKKDSKHQKNNSATSGKPKEGFLKRFAHFMDFDLLKDPSYLNLICGLSVFYVAELNFKMIVPFFFNNLNYNKSETAFFLSMTAIADIAARVVLPPICDRVNISRKMLFIWASIFLGISRSFLAEQTEYSLLMAAMVCNGFLRGATLINFTLTISEHCTLEKLPAAFGLHNVAKGLFIVALGPVIGVIRDVTGSYPLCIHAQTLLVYTCCAAWSIEYLIVYLKSRQKT